MATFQDALLQNLLVRLRQAPPRERAQPAGFIGQMDERGFAVSGSSGNFW
jgi:hypothetical protein